MLGVVQQIAIVKLKFNVEIRRGENMKHFLTFVFGELDSTLRKLFFNLDFGKELHIELGCLDLVKIFFGITGVFSKHCCCYFDKAGH